MPGITHTEYVDPKRLDDIARRAFTESLYQVHTTVFDGVEFDEFAKYVVDSKAERTNILLFKDGGAVVGYFAFHVFEKELGGRMTAVIRCEAGMLRKYRGGSFRRSSVLFKAPSSSVPSTHGISITSPS